MQAFEQVIAEIFWANGYWTQTSTKVELTKEEKRRIGRPSAPRWEIDVVAYSGHRNEILAIECKSFLDSPGVKAKELANRPLTGKSSYKMFVEPDLRKVVLGRLKTQLVERGSCSVGVTAKLALACGKIYGGDQGLHELREIAERNAWVLYEPAWIASELKRLSVHSYENQLSSIVSKLLLR